MSRVHFQFRQPDPDDPSGLGVVDAEVVEITPLRRRIDGQVVVLPRTVPVRLEQGEALVELAATGPSECWRAVEPDTGKTRYFLVPDVDGVLEYTELPDVDPNTLEPSAEPEAAWWAIVEALPLPAFRPDPDDGGALLVDLWSWQIASDDPNAMLVTVEV